MIISLITTFIIQSIIYPIVLFLYRFIERIGIATIRQGHIPSHIAFVMDGNRRWAKNRHIEPIDGHTQGYRKLEDALQWCDKLGVSTVTVFAFSIENFKRPQKEVDGLMSLADSKFKEMLKHPSIVDEYKICVRVLGRLDMLPDYVQESARNVMNYSKKYSEQGVALNMCIAYTSTDEILHSISQQISNPESEVSVHTMNKNMRTGVLQFPDPDLLIRTSGEIRLSDFMTWQCSGNSMLFFTRTMWPDFSVWNLLFILLQFQLWYPTMQRYKQTLAELDKKSKYSIES
jgi:ditrans,polycis-polyprenyl diphosphate synthase